MPCTTAAGPGSAEDGTQYIDQVCDSGAHIAMASMAVAVVVPLCCRILRCRGDLSAIGAPITWLDWRGDNAAQPPYVHLLTERHTARSLVHIVVKVALTSIGVFLPQGYAVAAAATANVAGGAALLATGRIFPPFVMPAACRFQTTLDMSVLWLFVCGLVSALTGPDSAAVAAMIPLTLGVLIAGMACVVLWPMDCTTSRTTRSGATGTVYPETEDEL